MYNTRSVFKFVLIYQVYSHETNFPESASSVKLQLSLKSPQLATKISIYINYCASTIFCEKYMQKYFKRTFFKIKKNRKIWDKNNSEELVSVHLLDENSKFLLNRRKDQLDISCCWKIYLFIIYNQFIENLFIYLLVCVIIKCDHKISMVLYMAMYKYPIELSKLFYTSNVYAQCSIVECKSRVPRSVVFKCRVI